MAGYMMVRPWPNKSRFYSRVVGAEGCFQARVILTEEDLARFFPEESGNLL